MTLELLNQICKEHNIPPDVHFTSNSGWECGPTEMNGLFYHAKDKTLEFTQDASIYDIVDHAKLGWVCIYNEGHKEFSPNCFKCKHRDTRIWEDPCTWVEGTDDGKCERFEED